MAGTMSAHPRGTSVYSQTLAEGYCSFTEMLFSHYRAMSACSLQLAALAHLVILAAAEVWPGTQRSIPLVILTGLVLVVVALMQRPQIYTKNASQCPEPAAPQLIPLTDDQLAGQFAAAGLSQFALTSREVALERQSQRLVEIADTAVRSRGEAERRGQAWADLMSKVSHELRTPLNAVIGFSDVMNAELFGPVGHPRYREYIHHIRDSGRALLKSAEDTLALTALLAQPSTSKPEILELDEFATEAWAFVSQDCATDRLTFKVIGLTGLEVLSERRPLRQILINLFSTATALAADDSVINLTARQDGDVAELEIAVTKLAPSRTINDGALPLSLARALLELQGTFLIELDGTPGTWRAVTVLSVATQQDFFSTSKVRSTSAFGVVC
ncbi:MAG: sensor histidine kinase [Hyphomicrobium sp.]